MLAQKEITEVHFWIAWGVADIQEIYLWNTRVRPKGWQPWENTVAYFPLMEDFSEWSWKWLTPSSTPSWITFTTQWWVKCAYSAWWSVSVPFSTNFTTWWNAFTFSFRCYKLSYNHEWQCVVCTWYWATNRNMCIWFHNNKFWTWWWNNDTDHADAKLNQRALYTWVYDWITMKAYIDWQLVNSKAMTYNVDSSNTASLLWQVISSASNPTNSLYWYVNNIVIENKARSEADELEYFNLTKSSYWL